MVNARCALSVPAAGAPAVILRHDRRICRPGDPRIKSEDDGGCDRGLPLAAMQRIDSASLLPLRCAERKKIAQPDSRGPHMSQTQQNPGGDTPSRDKPRLIRTYAGHSTARASSAVDRANLARGQTGRSVAFDLPTQSGYESDHVLSRGEVGKVGV